MCNRLKIFIIGINCVIFPRNVSFQKLKVIYSPKKWLTTNSSQDFFFFFKESKKEKESDAYSEVLPWILSGKNWHRHISQWMALLFHHTGQIIQSNITVHIYQASSDLSQEGDNTFISIPCHLTMWHLPLWRYSSVVTVAQMWNSFLAFIILFFGQGGE